MLNGKSVGVIRIMSLKLLASIEGNFIILTERNLDDLWPSHDPPKNRNYFGIMMEYEAAPLSKVHPIFPQ